MMSKFIDTILNVEDEHGVSLKSIHTTKLNKSRKFYYDKEDMYIAVYIHERFGKP